MIVGSLTISFIIYAIFKSILRKIIPDKKAFFIVSYAFALLLILLITAFTMGIIQGFIQYVPTLTLWLIVDLIKYKKHKNDVPEEEVEVKEGFKVKE
jgi:predicted PurR-regulated permease PerM